ncbi:hypothetical protein EVAR_101479_1 [Eumeta japonica]|uniref:Uncharacterized protein n=1 Tax=Eumeta variegata TaxID=151549 RepID=A0A4C1SX41_EUMVA|nr:hypothetical protein EVAR_101479_1 [Eumeta japonica]
MGGYPQENAEPNAHNVINQQFYQNNTAFPNIPPLTNHYSNLDLSSLLNHNIYGSPRSTGSSGQAADKLGAKSARSLVHSQSSLFSASPAGTSKDSTPDAFSSDDGDVSFIMPLSHKATLTSAAEDGRIRLIVPVSPSPSTAEVANSSSTLRVPSTSITRTTSEKVPNHSEMMAAMRAQWTRHTTK